jgi:hypothetical protein
MRPLLFVPYYLRWHYFEAQRKIFRLSANYTWFVWNFFSIGLLSKTLFAPWQRLEEKQRTGFDIEAYLSKLIINWIVRIFGAVIRTIFIVIGLFFLALGFVATALIYVFWLALPFLVIFFFLAGVLLLLGPSFKAATNT